MIELSLCNGNSKLYGLKRGGRFGLYAQIIRGVLLGIEINSKVESYRFSIVPTDIDL